MLALDQYGHHTRATAGIQHAMSGLKRRLIDEDCPGFSPPSSFAMGS